MEKYINKLISMFISTTEYANEKNVDYTIIITDDVYGIVFKDDPEYAERIIKAPYGLYYITKSEEQQLIIKNTQNEVDVFYTLCHELIHIYDYNKLAKENEGVKIRDLQNNIFYLLWSEFHAEYCSYNYLIQRSKDDIDPKWALMELKNKFKVYMNENKTINVQEAANFCVRLYGCYIALYDNFQMKLDKHPKQFFINEEFLEMYNYLFDHRTFDSIKGNLEELECVFKKLEK